MKSRPGIILFFMTFLIGSFFANETNSYRHAGVMLLPFRDLSDKKLYPESFQYQDIIFKSLKTAVTRFSRLNFEEQAFEGIIGDDTNADFTNETQGADVITGGTYRLEGKSPKITIILKMNITQLKDNKTQIKSYTLLADRRFVDSIDAVTKDLTKILGSIQIPLPVTAEPPVKTPPAPAPVPVKEAPAPVLPVLIFSNLKANLFTYEIWTNASMFAVLSNSNFNDSLSFPVDSELYLEIIRLSDKKTIFSQTYHLKENETHVIKFEPRGNIELGRLDYAEQWKEYNMQIGTNIIRENSVLTNIPADRTYPFLIKDQYGKTVYRQTIFLTNQSSLTINPVLEHKTGLHFMIYKTDETYAGLGSVFLFTRNFWIGAGCGFSPAENSILLFPEAEAGYYLWNDMAYPFRAGAGLLYHGWYDYSGNLKALTPNVPETIGRYHGVGGFAVAEAFGLFLRPAVLYNFTAVSVEFCFGIKF